MILKIEKIRTRVAIMHNIPKFFFRKLEAASSFGDHLFPDWAKAIFSRTDLLLKFLDVYNAYKAIPNNDDRALVIRSFFFGNDIERLCENDDGTEMITILDLVEPIRKPIEALFSYLYNVAIKYPAFEAYVNGSVAGAIDQFISKHKIEICPICGLESFLNLKGQARLALDHWLCQDIFPLSSVNFNNLIPIGSSCNARPAKGNINVLLDRKTNERIKAYYPYGNYEGVSTRFRFITEPSLDGFRDEDWEFAVIPNNPSEGDIFNSWNNSFNILARYEDFIKKNVLSMWESTYVEFVNGHDLLTHATSLESFKINLQHWKSSFLKRRYPGYRAYRSFINYLLYDAPESFLTGLYVNFRSEFENTTTINGA